MMKITAFLWFLGHSSERNKLIFFLKELKPMMMMMMIHFVIISMNRIFKKKNVSLLCRIYQAMGHKDSIKSNSNCRIVYMWASTPSQSNFIYVVWLLFWVFSYCWMCIEKRVFVLRNWSNNKDLNHVIYFGIFTGKIFWSWFGLGIAQMF